MKTTKKFGLGITLALASFLFVSGAPRALADTGPFAYNSWQNANNDYVMNSKDAVVVNFTTGTHDPVTFKLQSGTHYVVQADNRAVCSGFLDLKGANPYTQKPNISGSVNVHIVQYRPQGGTGNTCTQGGDSYTANVSIKNNLTATGGNNDTGPATITLGSKTYKQINTNTFKTVYGLNTDVDSCYGGELLVLNQVDSSANAPVNGTIVGLAYPPNATQAVGSVVGLPSGFPLQSATSNGICRYKDNSKQTVTVDASGTITKCTASDGTSCLDNSSGNTDPTQAAPTCESNFDSAFAWVICPAFNLADSAAGSFNSFIEDQLCFKTTTNTTSSTGSNIVCSGNNNLDTGVHNAWAIFRNIASALIVIALIVMVISQAISAGPFDAYTVRKMLPKLVAAVIIMQVSWSVLKYAIDLSNDAGSAIGHLLMAPFGGPGNLTLDKLMGTSFSTHTSGTNDTFAFFTILAAGTAAFIVSIPTIFLMAMYVVIALLIAFMVLVFRKILIIFLVMLAPLAFIAWVLPGMDRYWKLWKDNFIKMLLMFPMIMALLAAGRIFASITAGNSGVMEIQFSVAHLGPLPVPYVASVTSFADLIIIIAAFFAPYFLLPQTYKWGGAAMGSIAKGVQKGVERGSKPAKDYLTWRQGISPWKMARAQRRALSEQRVKDKFAERLADDGTKGTLKYLRGRTARGRLYGLSSRKANQDIVAKAVRSARAQQAQEATKDVQGYFEALALDTGGKSKGDDLAFTAGLQGDATYKDSSGNVKNTADTAMGVLGAKMRASHTIEERQAIFKKMAQYKETDSIKVGRDFVQSTAGTLPGQTWSSYANSGFLYDDFRGLDAQLMEQTRAPGGFFSRNASGQLKLNVNDRILAGQSERGWRDLVTEAQAKGLSVPEITEIYRRASSLEAAENMDDGARVYMRSVTGIVPAPHGAAPAGGGGGGGGGGGVVGVGGPAPTPGRGAVINNGELNVPHNSPEHTAITSDPEDIDAWVGGLPNGWQDLSDGDLMNIYNYRTGEHKAQASRELKRRNII